MLRITGNVPVTLMGCYRVLGGVVPGKSGESFGGGNGSGRTQLQADMALASRVIGFVDNKLPDEAVAFYRWGYASVEHSPSCYFLARYCWDAVVGDLEGAQLRVRDRFSALRMMIPFEVRHRLQHDGERGCTFVQLAEMLGIAEQTFRKNYGQIWERMIAAVMDIGVQNDPVVVGFLSTLSALRDDQNYFQKSA